MNPNVERRERWLALGLLLAALALGYLLLVHPWWTVPMIQVNEQVQDLRERDLRMRMQLQQAPQVRKQLQEAVTAQSQRPGFLPEASVELATAGLVQQLEAAVRQASPGNRSCAIRNQSPLAVPSQDRYPRVVVQVRLSCGTPELMGLLHAIESGSPRLFVNNLNILAQRQSYVGAGSGGGGLDVSFDLYGYLRPAGAVSAAVRATPTATPAQPPMAGGASAR